MKTGGTAAIDPKAQQPAQKGSFLKRLMSPEYSKVFKIG
jgi:hypothetical protein